MGNIAVAYNAPGEIENLKAIRQAVTNSTELKNINRSTMPWKRHITIT